MTDTGDNAALILPGPEVAEEALKEIQLGSRGTRERDFGDTTLVALLCSQTRREIENLV